ncbi:MAG: NlpC/P60 family protein [Pseudomonadota bacterium]
MADAPDPRVTPVRGDIAALHLRGVVEADEFVSGQLMSVAVPAAPMTAAPHGEAEMTTQLLFGEGFTVYEAKSGWAWGQSAIDNYVGYVPEADLIHAPAAEPTHSVRALQAIIYAEPDMKTRPIGAIPFGARVIVADEKDAFAALDPGGYAPAAALRPIRQKDPLWVAAAQRFRGAPYLWGGRTPAGFDCSGLIQIAMQSAGMACPRDSDQQMAALGREVDGKSLKRGDLVFWKGHVGVMTSPTILLHANAHHMEVAEEPFEAARDRIGAKEFGEILAIKRITA